MPNPDVIYSYTRAQALADGVLIDLAPIVRPLFSIPVAMTSRAFHTLSGEKDATLVIRAARILRKAIAEVAWHVDPSIDRVYFAVPDADESNVEFWALCHGGDNGEPVLTIMLQGED